MILNRNRPKIKLQLSIFDFLIESIAGSSLILLILLPIIFGADLPNELPMHFNIKGEVDSYGGKSILIALPLLGLFIYVALSILNKFPHIFNYPVQITEENAERMYRIGTRTLRSVKTIVIAFLCYQVYQLTIIGLEKSEGLNWTAMPIFMGSLLFIIVMMIIKSYQNK